MHHHSRTTCVSARTHTHACCAVAHARATRAAPPGSMDAEETKDAIEGFNQVVSMEGDKAEWGFKVSERTRNWC
jgi:hypothetical protein